MLESGRSVTEVSMAVGYANPSCFAGSSASGRRASSARPERRVRPCHRCGPPSM